MFCKKETCCCTFFRQSFNLFKKAIPIIIAQLVGWALFSYVEDDINVVSCFTNANIVAEKLYPEASLLNEQANAIKLFSRLQQKTGQVLSVNQSIIVYSVFKSHFGVPSHYILPKSTQAYLGCMKWYRFSVVTMTTIGYGTITPKSVAGKMLLIPYALITIPLMLSFLAFVGSLVSRWTEAAMQCVHKLVKGEKPLHYKPLKRCFYLFLAFWIVSLFLLLDYVFNPEMFESQGSARWLDGFYFMFVTFTTIGFGDITGPANDVRFFMLNFVFGLVMISGFLDSFMSLSSRLEFSLTGNSGCCCLHYTDDEDGVLSSGDADVDQRV